MSILLLPLPTEEPFGYEQLSSELHSNLRTSLSLYMTYICI